MKASELLYRVVEDMQRRPADLDLITIVKSLNHMTYGHDDPAVVKDIAPARERILRRIRRDIYPFGGLWEWLIHNKHATIEELRTEEGQRRLHATRIAWAKYLIADFKYNGD